MPLITYFFIFRLDRSSRTAVVQTEKYHALKTAENGAIVQKESYLASLIL